MAKVLTSGHVARALSFYNELESGKVYFIIGGNNQWSDENSPDEVLDSVYTLKDIIGLKLPNSYSMVIEVSDATGDDIITYRNKNYKKVSKYKETRTSGETTISNTNSITLKVDNTSEYSSGDKVRISWLSTDSSGLGYMNSYQGKVESITDTNTMTIKLDESTSVTIPSGSSVQGGAMVEGAKYVYVECLLENTENYTFPESTYRQIGICTGVVPVEGHSTNDPVLTPGEYASLGTLEILDNRKFIKRDVNQREKLSLIIEF